MNKQQRIQRLVEPNYTTYHGTRPTRKQIRKADWKQELVMSILIGAAFAFVGWLYLGGPLR